MATKTLPAIAAAALLLTACVAPSQPYLDQARTSCTTGDQDACRQVPGLQAEVNLEHQQQSEQAGSVALGVLAVVAGAALGFAEANAPVYTPVVVCRRNCW